jgi:hypothetical protein
MSEQFQYGQDFGLDGEFGSGFNRRVQGTGHLATDMGHAGTYRPEVLGGWYFADEKVRNGEIFYTHNFHASHGGCPNGYAFPYGGTWVCNTCGNSRLDRDWWRVKVKKDGAAWICYGVGFEDLQASDNYAFGDTAEEAISNYGDKMRATQ